MTCKVQSWTSLCAENRWTSYFCLLYILLLDFYQKLCRKLRYNLGVLSIMLSGGGTVVAFCGKILARRSLKPEKKSRLLLSNCLNWKIYCDDHLSLSSTTAATSFPGSLIFPKMRETLGTRLQPQYKYELFHINFTCIYYCLTSIKNYAGHYLSIMRPGGGTVVAFCGKILALVGGICKFLGANARGFPGMAADKCISSRE